VIDPPRASIRSRASASEKNQLALRHSARIRALKDVDRLQSARYPNGQALMGELVDDIEQAKLASIMGALLEVAGIVDNAHRRFFHRHIKTHEMRHLIAPSSMLELEPTSIHSSS
jgi:hypothetical protein